MCRGCQDAANVSLEGVLIMKIRRFAAMSLLLASPVLLAACAGSEEAMSDGMMSDSMMTDKAMSDAMMSDAMMTDGAMSDGMMSAK